MPRNSFYTWVKNVHKLRTEGWETHGQLSTLTYLATRISSLLVNKPQVIPALIHPQLTQLFTGNFATFNPLISQLYPVSTPPTIKRKKER